jgi:hypothetical protein
VRRTLALVATAAVAALVAVIMGEYEPTVWTALATGVVVGAGLPEVVLGIARWRGPVPAAVTALCAAGSVVWAGWISAGRGLNPIRGTVWLAAAVAAVIAGLRLARGGEQDALAVAASEGEDPSPTAV